MASPFSIFRKNQKMMIAVLGILTMFAFVFLPILAESLGIRSNGPVNKVVVKSDYGDLKESDINNLMQEHRKVLSVLIAVRQMTGDHPMLAQRFAEYYFGGGGEEQTVNTWLLAQHARKLGMVVTDETINAFLKQWTRDSVKGSDFAAAFKRAGLSELQFFDLMRNELSARQLRTMFYFTLGGITPAERWECFNRVKQMAHIEAAPVNVASFIDKVDDPSDEELKAFFEKYKADYALPGSPDPGFREPQKVALQWFKADREKFAASVTDAEIEERYEKNKAKYDELEKRFAPPVTLPADKDAKPAATDAAEKKAEQPQDEKPATDKPATDAAAPETKPAENPPAAKDAAAPTDAAPPAKDAEDAKKDSKDTSAVRGRSPFKLVSFLEDAKPADTAAPAADAKPAEPSQTPAAQEKPAEQPATPAAQEKPAEGPKTPAVQEKPAEQPATPAVQEKPAEEPKTPAVQEKPAEPKSGLTDALKNRIRREIADEKVLKVFGGLRDQMQRYGTQWSKYQLVVRQKKKQDEASLPPAPAKLDFEKLAGENGLSVGQIGLTSKWDMRSTEIGDSLVDGSDPVWNNVFQSPSLFRPQISLDPKSQYFLLWKTDATKDRIPKFEDEGVRAAVLREWKMIQARELALKQAESLAAEVTKSKKTLKEAFAGRPDLPVVLPSAFSWMTFGSVPLGSAPEAARISDVAGVEFAGQDFMRTVFRLQPDQIGAALNGPKTVAYVIRVIEFTPSREVLTKEFQIDDFSKYAPVARSQQQELVRAWMDEIERSAGLKWERKPMDMEAGPQSEE